MKTRAQAFAPTHPAVTLLASLLLAAALLLPSFVPQDAHGFRRATTVTGPRGRSGSKVVTASPTGNGYTRDATVAGPNGASATRNTRAPGTRPPTPGPARTPTPARAAIPAPPPIRRPSPAEEVDAAAKPGWTTGLARRSFPASHRRPCSVECRDAARSSPSGLPRPGHPRTR